MGNEQLQKLEQLHQNCAGAILRIREFIQYENDFTETKKAEIEKEIKSLIGTAQLQMDGLPDYRQFGQGLE